MRPITRPLIWLLFLIAACKSGPKTIYDQRLPLKQLQEDMTYFRLILNAVHPGLYLYHSKAALDKSFDSVYNTLKADATVMDLYSKMSALVNMIQCGHTGCYLPEAYTDSMYKVKGFFPIPVNWVEDKLVVNTKDAEIPFGAAIISINGDPARWIMDQICIYEPVDGFNIRYQKEEGAWDLASNYFKLRGPQEQFKVSYQTDDTSEIRATSMKGVDLNTALNAERAYAFAEDVNYDLELFDDDHYAVMTVYTFGYDSWSTDHAFENFLENSFRLLSRSPSVSNLIIDLRNNTGGNFRSMFKLYSYLTKRERWKEFNSAYTIFNKIPFTPYLSGDVNDAPGIQASIDSSFSYSKNGRYAKEYVANEEMFPSGYRFGGKVFVITNSNVQSAAAYFASLLKDEGRAQIVGDETGGSGTNTNSFHLLTYELPNTHIQLTVPVVHAEFALLRGAMPVGHGVIPDHAVSLSLADLRTNTDPQLGLILDSLMR